MLDVRTHGVPASMGVSVFPEEQAAAKSASAAKDLRTLSLGPRALFALALFGAFLGARAEEDELLRETDGDVAEEERSERHRRFHLCADRAEDERDDERDRDRFLGEAKIFEGA